MKNKLFIMFLILFSSTLNLSFGYNVSKEIKIKNRAVFKDPEVQKFINDYDAFLKLYMEALKMNDSEKLQAISGDLQTISNRSDKIFERLTTPEETEKFLEEIKKLAEEFTDFVSKNY